MRLEKLRDLDVMPVFFAFQIVFHQDKRLLARAADTVKFPIRAAFLDQGDFYFSDIEAWKTHSRLAKQQIGFHG
jgi:hypothetical protein